MTPRADDLVTTYLRRLDHELRALPKATREEVVEDVTSHIAEAFAELGEPGEADVRNILERLGAPEDVAAEALERFEARPRGGDAREIATILLLLFGGFAFVIGWFVGLVLLWVSDAWTTRDKLIGTLVVPGGLVPLLYVATYTLEPADSGTSVRDVLIGIALAALVVGPIFTSIYFARRMRRPIVASC